MLNGIFFVSLHQLSIPIRDKEVKFCKAYNLIR